MTSIVYMIIMMMAVVMVMAVAVAVAVQFRIMVYRVLGIMVSCFFFISCGDMYPQDPLAHSHQPLIIHPMDTDITEGKAKELEYLVAFKDHSSLTSSPDYALHSASLHQQYYQDFVETGYLEDVELISSVDMFDDYQSPDHDTQIDTSIPFSLSSLMPENAIHKMDQMYGRALISKVRFSTTDQARHTLAQWQKDQYIWYAEPNRYSSLFVEEPSHRDNVQAVAKDYKERNESGHFYHIKQLKIDKALDIVSRLSNKKIETLRSNAPIIAIVDSGVDIEHPALKNRVAVFSGFNTGLLGCAANGCNTSRPSNQDYKKGRKLGNAAFYPAGSNGHGNRCEGTNCHHGTHVTGLAVGYQKDQVYGACPFCRFLPIKVTDEKGKIPDVALLRAYEFVNQYPKVRVLNASLGKDTSSISIRFITKSLSKKGRGIVLIAAAGNAFTSEREFPAAYEHFTSVAAIGPGLKKSDFSNSGYWVDVAASGNMLQSSISGGSTNRQGGTSQASPLVAGIAGLILAVRPYATFAQVNHLLRETSDLSLYATENKSFKRKIANSNQTVRLLGKGIVDAEKALKWAITNNLNASSTKQTGRKRIPATGCSILMDQNTTQRHVNTIAAETLDHRHSAILWIITLLLPFFFLSLFQRLALMREREKRV
ncbi:MAG: S8/S53 family peptidase [Proteobacteria bacterium]|nr:S8/S53 family peptidase [Pseudomonadota bacterium]